MDKKLQDAIQVANHYGVTDQELASAVEAATAARRDEADTPGLVALVHPDLPNGLLVDPGAVDVYAKSGWRVKPEEPPADAAPDEQPDASTTKAKTTKDK